MEVTFVQFLCFSGIDMSVLRGWVDRENGGLVEMSEGLLSSQIMQYK